MVRNYGVFFFFFFMISTQMKQSFFVRVLRKSFLTSLLVTTCIEKNIWYLNNIFFPILRKNINADDWANRPRVGGKFTPAKCMKNYNRKYLSERHRLVMMIIIKKECKPQANSTKFIRYSEIFVRYLFFTMLFCEENHLFWDINKRFCRVLFLCVSLKKKNYYLIKK